MLDEPTGDGPTDADHTSSTPAPAAAPRRRRAASRPAGPPAVPAEPAVSVVGPDASAAAPAKKTARKRTSRAATAAATSDPVHAAGEPVADVVADTASMATAAEADAAPASTTRRRRASKKTAAPVETVPVETVDPERVDADLIDPDALDLDLVDPDAVDLDLDLVDPDAVDLDASVAGATVTVPVFSPGVLFQPPDPSAAVPARRRRGRKAADDTSNAESDEAPVALTGRSDRADRSGSESPDSGSADGGPTDGGPTDAEPTGGEPTDREPTEDSDDDAAGSRRRRRGGRGRRGRGAAAAQDGTDPDSTTDGPAADESTDSTTAADAEGSDEDESGEGTTTDGETGAGTRRRRRRRRRGGADDGSEETSAESGESVDDAVTVTRVREPRSRGRGRGDRGGGNGSDRDDDDGVRSVKGSTRLEAKKQRRREGREAGRRRPSVITEAEFLARREAVDRRMIVRQTGDRTQIAVLEDGVLVEHYVSSASSAGLVGNVYLGRVQNVLPSMEAAFIDIGKGRNAVLYAGEVNWDAAGLEGQPRRIELALKSGDPVLVQVTKDTIGHKGARLTSQISLAGRYLVLVPGGSMTGISRKLPDTERTRLKAILRKVVPEGAGVIVRTAAEGASEDELARDVARLTAQWEDIDKKSTKGSAATALLYGEPDMTIRVVRDIFNEDVDGLVVSGDEAWDVLDSYVSHVAPDLRDRMTRWTSEQDVFTDSRIDEQLVKALDRKVWLPSGGYLVIDRTEAMIVVDVNTGKFIGAGGNLEETVTKNNLEAAEELVRQLRLRDLGGIIVVDFIDMVLESNRDLVLRRLLECLGRDRTKHQVAEVTSLGLVQMTRKRVGQGLHEVFAETCDSCSGRGYHIHTEPVERSSAGSTGSSGAPTSSNGGATGERKGRGRGRGGAGNGSGIGSTDSVSSASVPATLVPPKPRPVPQHAPEDEPVIDLGPAAAGGPDPVAAEDPVEAASLVGHVAFADTAERTEAAPKAPRRRRKAVSPVTTL